MAKKGIVKPMRPIQAAAPKQEEVKNPLDSLELAITTGAQQVMQVTGQFIREETGNRITPNNSYALEVKMQQVLQNQLGTALRIVAELKAVEAAKPAENKEPAKNESATS